jgi:hypothetical protein
MPITTEAKLVFEISKMHIDAINLVGLLEISEGIITEAGFKPISTFNVDIPAEDLIPMVQVKTDGVQTIYEAVKGSLYEFLLKKGIAQGSVS